MAPDLDSELRDLGAAIELPPTPDLARAVRARLEPAPRRPRRRALRALALATLAVLVPAATVLAASPAARDAVLDWLGLGGAKVERVPRLPRVPPGARIDLGPQVALRTARERAPFGVLVPALLGTPDAVHLHAGTAAGPVVSLVYRPGPRLPPTPETGVGLLVREWRGQVERERVQKLVVGGAERVRVGRARGLWLSGGPTWCCSGLATGTSSSSPAAWPATPCSWRAETGSCGSSRPCRGARRWPSRRRCAERPAQRVLDHVAQRLVRSHPVGADRDAPLHVDDQG
jgi:hypothetical protein